MFSRCEFIYDKLGFPITKLSLCISLSNSGEDISYCIYKCFPYPILSLILSGTQFAYTVDVFIPLAPQLDSSLVFSISLFPSTEISSYLLFILLSFFLSYFQTSFKNTHRILGNGRVGNSKGLVFHRNKENLTKMIFIRTQRLTATK